MHTVKNMKQKSRLLPPTYFYSMLILLIILHFLCPISILINQPYSYSGIAIIIIGIILNVWTDKLFKHEKTTVKPYEIPSHLIVEGPFKISRHPMYLGMVIILSGIAIFLGSIITFIFPFTFIFVIEIFFIPYEEQNLERTFKQEFIEYKKNVRRWI